MTGENFEVDSSDVDIGDSMAETLAQIQSGELDVDVEETVEDVEDTADEVETEAPTKGRKRGKDGKFIKADAVEEDEPADEPDEPPVDEPAQQEDTEEEETTPEVPDIDPRLARAPTTWRNEAKAKWNDIDPTIREEILKREEDIGKGIGTYKADAEYGRAVQQSLQPYMPMINAAGATPNKVVTSMLDTYYKLQTSNPQQKAELLLQAAHQYGADLSVFKQDFDPAQNTVNMQLHPLLQKIDSLEQRLGQRDQFAEQQELTQATSAIEAFRNALDDSGKPKYPYFETVREEIADRIARSESVGQSMSLEDAYDSAVWATPELRAALLAKQSSDTEAKRQKEAAEKAKKAKEADSINVSQRGSYSEQPHKPTGSVEDTLKEELARIKNAAG